MLTAERTHRWMRRLLGLMESAPGDEDEDSLRIWLNRPNAWASHHDVAEALGEHRDALHLRSRELRAEQVHIEEQIKRTDNFLHVIEDLASSQ